MEEPMWYYKPNPEDASGAFPHPLGSFSRMHPKGLPSVPKGLLDPAGRHRSGGSPVIPQHNLTDPSSSG